jgi:peptide/nickel transport system substrate-binding protein
MRPTDLASIAKLPLVAKQQLEAAGFKVDMQQMDWATLVARRAKKDAPAQGGWNAFMTAWTAGDILNPLTLAMMNAARDYVAAIGEGASKNEANLMELSRILAPLSKKKVAA